VRWWIPHCARAAGDLDRCAECLRRDRLAPQGAIWRGAATWLLDDECGSAGGGAGSPVGTGACTRTPKPAARSDRDESDSDRAVSETATALTRGYYSGFCLAPIATASRSQRRWPLFVQSENRRIRVRGLPGSFGHGQLDPQAPPANQTAWAINRPAPNVGERVEVGPLPHPGGRAVLYGQRVDGSARHPSGLLVGAEAPV